MSEVRKFDSHGYQVHPDPKDPPAQGVSVPVIAFECFDRATGAKLLCDPRTFDPERHTLEDPAKPAEA